MGGAIQLQHDLLRYCNESMRSNQSHGDGLFNISSVLDGFNGQADEEEEQSDDSEFHLGDA